MRKFIDQNEPDEIVTEAQLFEEFKAFDNEDGITFGQYIHNCLESEGGTLREIR